MVSQKIYDIKRRPLPKCLIESAFYLELNDSQKYNYISRLIYIEEIITKIYEFLEIREDKLSVFIDRIELDLYINCGITNSHPNEYVSAWLTHSSWVHDIDANVTMKRKIQSVLREECIIILSIDYNYDEFKMWLMNKNKLLKKLLDRFYQAKSSASSVLLQIAIDVLICEMLSGIISTRINPRLNELMAE